MSNPRTRVGISSIEDIIRCHRLRWFGHLQRMDKKKKSPRKITNFEVNGSSLGAAQRKYSLTTLDVTLTNCGY